MSLLRVEVEFMRFGRGDLGREMGRGGMMGRLEWRLGMRLSAFYVSFWNSRVGEGAGVIMLLGKMMIHGAAG